jgi:hypothetical protein
MTSSWTWQASSNVVGHDSPPEMSTPGVHDVLNTASYLLSMTSLGENQAKHNG